MVVSTEEWNAGVYHQAANPHVGWGAGVVAAANLQGDERVADVGCGTGRVTAQLLEQLPDGYVLGVDRSANMIEEARRQIEPRYPRHVAFLQRDLLLLTSEDVGEPFDVVFSTATFHWIRDHETLFRRLFAILKPGGRLVAQCGGGPNLKRHVTRAERLMASESFRQWFAGWNAPRFYAVEKETAAAMHHAGFGDVATAVVEAPTILGDAEEFATFLSNIVFREHILQIPDESMRVEFIAALTHLAAQDDPPYELDYWRLNMRGTRPIS